MCHIKQKQKDPGWPIHTLRLKYVLLLPFLKSQNLTDDIHRHSSLQAGQHWNCGPLGCQCVYFPFNR